MPVLTSVRSRVPLVTLPPALSRVGEWAGRRLGLSPTSLEATFVPVRTPSGLCARPLRPSDGPAWTGSMRANRERMSQWWAEIEDWQAGTGDAAFAEHYRCWHRSAVNETGLCLVIDGGDGLVGECQLWHMRPGGTKLEIGLWCRPGVRTRDLWAVVGGILDEMILWHGIVRVDAPVESANPAPRKILEGMGFPYEGTLRSWRLSGPRMVDFDMYGMTRDLWLEQRERTYAEFCWISDRGTGLLPAPSTSSRTAKRWV